MHVWLGTQLLHCCSYAAALLCNRRPGSAYDRVAQADETDGSGARDGDALSPADSDDSDDSSDSDSDEDEEDYNLSIEMGRVRRKQFG